jgi:hypothetical protein
MKSKIKNFILRLLFTQKQRAVIWCGTAYSCLHYLRKNNRERAAFVFDVLSDTEDMFGEDVTQSRMSMEILKHINRILDFSEECERMEMRKNAEAYRKFVEDVAKCDTKPKPRPTIIGKMVIDLSECKDCSQCEDCIVRQAIEEVETENKHKEEEPESSESTPTEEPKAETETPANGVPTEETTDNI